MLHKVSFILTALLLISYLNVSFANPQQTTVSEIKKSLVCLCDCGMTVEACQGAMTCDSAEKLTAELTQYVEQGMTKDAIFSTFIGKYGEHILAAPTKKGFNLTAWILPFLGLLLATIAIIAALRRWVHQQQLSNAKAKVKEVLTNSIDSGYEKKLDEVLRKLD